REPDGEPGVHEVAGEHAERRARKHTPVDDLRWEAEHAREQARKHHQVHDVVEEQREERVPVARDEPAVRGGGLGGSGGGGPRAGRHAPAQYSGGPSPPANLGPRCLMAERRARFGREKERSWALGSTSGALSRSLTLLSS